MLTPNIDLAMQKYNFSFLLFSILLSCGCVPESKETLPVESAVHNPQLVGDFYIEDKTTGKRDERWIKVKDQSKGLYTVGSDDSKPNEKGVCQLFKIGSTYILAVKVKEDDPTSGYFFGRVEIGKSQLFMHHMDEKFFINNPGALPGTKLTPSTIGAGVSVSFTSSPEQLKAFFTLHDGNDDIWDTKSPMAMNRIGI